MLEVVIKELLEQITNLKAYPVFGTVEPPFLAYDIKYLNSNYTNNIKLTVKIIHKDFDEMLLIRDKLINSLNAKTEDKSLLLKNEYVARFELAGSGYLFNDSIQVFEENLIFTGIYYKK